MEEMLFLFLSCNIPQEILGMKVLMVGNIIFWSMQISNNTNSDIDTVEIIIIRKLEIADNNCISKELDTQSSDDSGKCLWD